MALTLSRTKHRPLTNPSLIHFLSFSSSSSSFSTAPPPNDNTAADSQPPQEQPSFASYFSDVKKSLKRQQEQRQGNPPSGNQKNSPNLPPFRQPTSANPSLAKPVSQIEGLDEIRKNLSEFRRRSSVPPPSDLNSAAQSSSGQHQQISFEQLYKRNVVAKGDNSSGSIESGPNGNNPPFSKKASFEAIKESLRQMGSNTKANSDKGFANAAFLSGFRSSLNLKPMNETDSVKSAVVGGTRGMPLPLFGKETKQEDGNDKGSMSTQFLKIYSYEELGKELKRLRPEVKQGQKGWFSLEELNERLRKLREQEEQARIGGVSFKDLRESLLQLQWAADEKNRKIPSEYK